MSVKNKYLDPTFRYADLRLALHWAKNARDAIKKETSMEISDSIKNSYGYLKRYCDIINLEDK